MPIRESLRSHSPVSLFPPPSDSSFSFVEALTFARLLSRIHLRLNQSATDGLHARFMALCHWRTQCFASRADRFSKGSERKQNRLDAERKASSFRRKSGFDYIVLLKRKHSLSSYIFNIHSESQLKHN